MGETMNLDDMRKELYGKFEKLKEKGNPEKFEWNEQYSYGTRIFDHSHSDNSVHLNIRGGVKVFHKRKLLVEVNPEGDIHVT